jgi:hypothetical protein
MVILKFSRFSSVPAENCGMFPSVHDHFILGRYQFILHLKSDSAPKNIHYKSRSKKKTWQQCAILPATFGNKDRHVGLSLEA